MIVAHMHIIVLARCAIQGSSERYGSSLVLMVVR